MPSNTQQMDEVQQQLVDRYRKMLAFCERLWSDIERGETLPDGEPPKRQVKTLDKMISDMIDSGKQVDQLVAEVEGDPVPGGQAPPAEKVNSDSEVTRELVEIKLRLSRIRSLLRGQFGAFLGKQASLLRLAQTDETAAAVVIDMMKDMATEAAEAVGIESARVAGIDSDGEACRIRMRGSDGNELVVLVDGDMIFRSAYHGKQPCVLGWEHYVATIRPIFLALGHWRPLGTDWVLTKKSSLAEPIGGESETDEFEGFVPPGEPAVFRVETVGGGETKDKSCRVSRVSGRTASVAEDTRTKLQANMAKIRDAALVKIVKPGSKYDGVAGTVDPGKISVRNDHLEFPVGIQHNTGLRTELWVTDDEVEVVLSKRR